MAKYKLVVSYEIDTEEVDALSLAHELLKEIPVMIEANEAIPEVTLLRDGDRSNANLLFPLKDNSGHYKHGKVPITQVCESWNK